MICLKWDVTSEILIIIHEGVLENVTMLLVFPPERSLSLLVRLSEHPDMKYETYPHPRHRPRPPRVSNVLKLDIFTKFRTQFLNLSLFPIWCARAKNIVIVCQSVSEAWNGRNIFAHLTKMRTLLIFWRSGSKIAWEFSMYWDTFKLSLLSHVSTICKSRKDLSSASK